jgi:hypothetical protein
MRARCFLVFVVLIASTTGCASYPYQFGRARPDALPPQADEFPEPQLVRRGEDHRFLDGVRNTLDKPRQWWTGEPRPVSFAPRPDTEGALTEYLAANEQFDTQINYHYYSPSERWQRLRNNTRISPVWRYTAGTVNWLGYTVFPGRAWGMTGYDPFSDTLEINSDDVPEVLNAAANAKDITSRRFPGTYAVVTEIPGPSIYRSARAAGDVAGYARHVDDWPLEQDSMRSLYPRVGSEALGAAIPQADFVEGLILSAVGGVTGRLVAERQIANRRRERSTFRPNDFRSRDGMASDVMPGPEAIEGFADGAPYEEAFDPPHEMEMVRRRLASRELRRGNDEFVSP